MNIWNNEISANSTDGLYNDYNRGADIDELGAEWLYVYTDNEVAINLYKNLGFKITGKYDKKICYGFTWN